MKSLDDVQEKMAALYQQVESGATDLKMADSLANIAGKYLKAEQLKLAKEIFIEHKRSRPALAAPDSTQASDVVDVEEADPQRFARSPWPSVRRHTLKDE